MTATQTGGLVVPRSHVLWGNLFEAQRDMLGFHLAVRRQHGDFLKLRIGRAFQYYFLAHPDDIERVLQQPATAVSKGLFWKPLKKLLGEGLLTSDGEYWRSQRRIMQPALHRNRHGAWAQIIAKTSEETLQRWHALENEPLDITEEMMRVTLQNAGLTIFGTDLSEHSEVLGRAMSYAVEYANVRSYRWISPPHTLRFRNEMNALYRVIDEMIERRRAQLKNAQDETHDLLSTLLLARDENGEAQTTRQLRDEIMTFLFTGHETTAIALGWTWHLLSLHPEVEERLHAELEQVLGARLPTGDDLPELAYTRMIIQETMRLYPPVWAISRHFNADEEIRGHRIPARAPVVTMPYVTHRHPEFWENPDKFEPERFSPQAWVNRPRFAYFPFGGGPRQCLGNHFALMEAQLLVAAIAQRYRLKTVPNHVVEVAPLVSLRPRNGIMMRLEAR